MCAALAQLGHQITLLAAAGPAVGNVTDYAYYGVQPVFKLEKLGNPIASAGNRNPYFLIQVLYCLSKTRGKLHLVYGRSPAALQVASFLGVPLVYEIHAPPSSLLRRCLEGVLLANPLLRRVVFISEALRQEYSRRFPKVKQIETIVAHDGADVTETDGPAQLRLPGDPALPRAGYFGSMYKGKGAELLPILGEAVPTWEFHAVGGTPADVRRMVSATAAANVHWHGRVPPSEVRDYMAAMDALLLPAQERVQVLDKGDIAPWMSPLKMFEYMACGKPIIASDLPVLREVLVDGLNSLLVSPADVSAWAGALQRIRSNDQLASELGRRARNDLIGQFSWIRRAERVLEGLTR